jgi:hypothetical protein
MTKGGWIKSGDKSKQRYICSHCHKTTTKFSPTDNVSPTHHYRAIIDFSELEYAQINLRSLKANYQDIPSYIKSVLFREH